jgi:hypothetical protein
VWLGLYGIRLCHISINPQWIHIVIALPPPPLRLLRAAIRRVRLIDIRINTRPAHSTGGQTSGQLRKRETLMTRQHPAQLTVLHHHRFFLRRFLFLGILFLAGEEEKSNEAGNRIEISFFSSFFFKGGKYLIDDSKGEFFFYSKRRGESCVMQKVVVAANGRVCQQQAVQSIGRESTRAPVCHHLQESFLKGEK